MNETSTPEQPVPLDLDLYKDDIPLQAAMDAHRGTSFVPEQRAIGERASYALTLAQDLATLTALANTSEKQALLAEEFARYREGFKAKTLAYLAAKSRCMSTMIAGPANFPTASNRKRSNSADNRCTELLEFRKRALDAIRKTLQPELRPIMSGDADAVERLKAKIEEAEKLHERMKAANSAIRKAAKGGEAAQAAALVALGYSEVLAAELLKGDCFGNKGYAPYEITNNGANIRRLKDRLVVIERTKATPAQDVQGAAARMEVAPADNRIRLYFPGKPSEEIRTKLKSVGFRWKPSASAWSGYINSRTQALAAEIAGVVAQP